MTPSPAGPRRILVVGPYAPYRDGIAAYVVQQVRDLRRQGNHVEVVSPLPSAAHHHLDFHQPRGLLGLRGLSRGFDRVILHFHPDFYFPQPMTFAVRTSHAAALAAAIRTGPPATLVLHEIDERWGTARDAAGVAARAMIRSFDELHVHDEAQAAQLRRAFGADPARISVVPHGAHFAAHTGADRATARAALGIDPDAHVSLCIGFVAEHKGFDRAVTAFGRATSSVDVLDGDRRRAELHVVGSPSVGNPAAARYAHELASLAEATPGVTFHDGYVADATFDRWLLACDLVLLPYRFIWSSGVAERAALFDRPVIATAVGGLAEQLSGTAGNRVIEDDDHALAEALVEALTEAEVLPAEHGDVVGADWPSTAARQEVLAAVRERAQQQRGFAFVAPDAPTGARSNADGAAVAGSGGSTRGLAGLRRLGPLARPIPVSGRPGVTGIKRLQRRLLDWELEPIIGWVDELRRATQEAVETSVTLASDRRADEPAKPPAAPKPSPKSPARKKKRPTKSAATARTGTSADARPATSGREADGSPASS